MDHACTSGALYWWVALLLILQSLTVTGPAVGAYVSRSLGWRWTFWLLVIVVSRKILKKFGGSDSRLLDWCGFHCVPNHPR